MSHHKGQVDTNCKPCKRKDWAELTLAEQLERLVGVVRRLEKQLDTARYEIDFLKFHNHSGNLVVVPFDSVNPAQRHHSDLD